MLVRGSMMLQGAARGCATWHSVERRRARLCRQMLDNAERYVASVVPAVCCKAKRKVLDGVW